MSRHAEKQRCPACGAEFLCLAHCGANTCWCLELPRLPMPVEAEARCLCPACLQVRIERELKPPAT
jgi:hypothetical protein